MKCLYNLLAKLHPLVGALLFFLIIPNLLLSFFPTAAFIYFCVLIVMMFKMSATGARDRHDRDMED